MTKSPGARFDNPCLSHMKYVNTNIYGRRSLLFGSSQPFFSGVISAIAPKAMRLVLFSCELSLYANYHLKWGTCFSQCPGSGWGWSSKLNIGRCVSVWTVRNRLIAAGYRSRHPGRCPGKLLIILNAAACWHTGTKLEPSQGNHPHWSHLIFADESRVN